MDCDRDAAPARVRHRFAAAASRAAPLFAALLANSASAQDLSVAAILQPVSGCALSSAENVIVRVFNYGAALPAGTAFNVSYTINAGAPVSEPVTLAAPLLTDSTYTYTFAAPADLSAPGTYLFDATVQLPGDLNPANDALVGIEVDNSAPSVGGSVDGPATPVLEGSVSLAGQTGDVIEWQQSIDGLRWRRLANTTTTQAFALLRENTEFRARVKSGDCAPALSGAFTVTSSDPIFYSGFEP